MKREYDEIMEHIQMTPEIRKRVLAHIREADIAALAPKVLPFSRLKKYWSAAACLVLLLVGAITLPHLLDREVPEPPVQAVPQIEEVYSLQELSTLVGFEISEDFSLPFVPEEISYLSFWRELAEVTYSGGGQSAAFRKSVGTEDNSGDFTVYDAITEIAVNGHPVTLKGSGEMYALAVWTDGTFSFSLRLTQAAAKETWEGIFTM